MSLKGFLVPYVQMIKGDTDEQDKHCGKFMSRGKGVKNVCRYCTCPAEELDNPYTNHPRKTKSMIMEILKDSLLRDKSPQLQRISQKYILNAWYEFVFGGEKILGLNIHGASPMEILHWIQLGLYKDAREGFFPQLGKGS